MSKLLQHSFLVLAILLSACSDEQGQLASDTGEIAFEAVTFESWEAKLASYPPDIVVVDLWASWCVSCLERFPHMVAMWHEFRDRGVRFVSLNLDDYEDEQALADAKQLLRRFGAEFENYYMDENLMQAFARLDLIGIPAVFIYDRGGREVVRLTGDDPNRQFSDADVAAAISALLDTG